MASYFAIVSFGGSFPGPSVYESEEEARAALDRAERDTAAGDGDMRCDPVTLSRTRIYEYATREAAERADISDRGPDGSGARHGTPEFVRVVLMR